ncbi:major royal jelly protein-domain-containing protein [Xylaria bambusicola]|uniref:major royal jelly protein-domain-containing protein n=1 Tax=Xylaria bambusicola TaxID=326684 RepID=UPI0020081CED|nr:major royal jelly protein-domain-containing protein [Xylaria bambusicola]KAI0505177.1 major royal jelly protein-domain-containing protein [Xylaria bambusicola]
MAIGLIKETSANGDFKFISDSGLYGPTLEVAHAYYGQWPTGLDATNVYNGSNNVIQVGEHKSITEEAAYPSLEMNQPPGGAINYTTTPPTSANHQDYFISVQSVVVDALDRLWILDTGRVIGPNGAVLPAAYGGPKLVGVDLTINKVFKAIVFPPEVAYADSYLNDVRFDLRASVTESGQGIGYITDSSFSGRNAIIVVDLGTGESWRHIGLTESVRGESQFLSFIWGQPMYYTSSHNSPLTTNPVGSDGIALSVDGETLYFGPFASRYMYSVPTARLRARGSTSELLAQQSVVNHGQKGHSDGFETDSNNLIYVGNGELNAINVFNPANGTTSLFVRDPRINWVDTMSVATDGYLYFTSNQLLVNHKTRPFALFKAPLPDGAAKVPYVS